MQRLKRTNTSRDLIGLQSSLGGSNETLDSPQRPRGRTTDSIDLPKINQTPNQPQDERGISVAQTLRPYSTKRIKSFPRSKTQQELNQLEEAFPGITIKSEADLFSHTSTRVHHSSALTEFSGSSFTSIFSSEISHSKSVSALLDKQTEHSATTHVRWKTSRVARVDTQESPIKGRGTFTLGRKFNLGTTDPPSVSLAQSFHSLTLTQLLNFLLDLMGMRNDFNNFESCIFFAILPVFCQPKDILMILENKLRLSSFLDSSSDCRIKSIAVIMQLLTLWLRDHLLRDFPPSSEEQKHLMRFTQYLQQSRPHFESTELHSIITHKLVDPANTSSSPLKAICPMIIKTTCPQFSSSDNQTTSPRPEDEISFSFSPRTGSRFPLSPPPPPVPSRRPRASSHGTQASQSDSSNLAQAEILPRGLRITDRLPNPEELPSYPVPPLALSLLFQNSPPKNDPASTAGTQQSSCNLSSRRDGVRSSQIDCRSPHDSGNVTPTSPRKNSSTLPTSPRLGAAFCPKSRRSKNNAIAFGTDTSPILAACNMTLYSTQLINQIEPTEFLDYGFGVKMFPNKTIGKAIDYFNLVSNWVATRILSTAELEERVNVLKAFISFAHQLYRLKNFHLLMAVFACLESSAICRLRQTWLRLSEKYRERMKSLRKLLSTSKNYSKYRSAIAKLRCAKQSCIPYLGIYLRDLTFIHEGNATLHNDLINYSKIQLVSSTIQEFDYFRKNPVFVSDIATINDYLIHLLSTCSDREKLHLMSLQIEPRESSKSLSPSTSSPDFCDNLDVASLTTIDPVGLSKPQLERLVLQLQKELRDQYHPSL